MHTLIIRCGLYTREEHSFNTIEELFQFYKENMQRWQGCVTVIMEGENDDHSS